MRVICPYCRLGTKATFIKGSSAGALAAMRCPNPRCGKWLIEPEYGHVAIPMPHTAKYIGGSWVDLDNTPTTSGVHIPGVDPDVIQLENPRIEEVDFGEYLNEYAREDVPPLHHGRYMERPPADEKTLQLARQIESLRKF